MIHLAGRTREKVNRALEEINVYKQEGLSGAIIEDYHGTLQDVKETLKLLPKDSPKFRIGINLLEDPYYAFELAEKYERQFIQLDTIQASRRFDENLYLLLRRRHPNLYVFGGIRFKYIPPTGKSLEEDIRNGMSRCDAIVTTGEGTGIETPTQKLVEFKKIMENFPLIVGAGLNDRNAREQLAVADGAIIGSYFKEGRTDFHVDRQRVREIVKLINRQQE